jgi:hypothetical protein
MKKLIVLVLITLVARQITQAQGTTYVSTLGQSSSGGAPIGSDSWRAAAFRTGSNSGGYILDSVQIAMTGASGVPTGFTVMLYAGFFPQSGLTSLSGSANPSTAGVYDYTPPSSLALAPRTYYNVVLTAGTPTANGAYGWSTAVWSPGLFNQSGGWAGYFIGASCNYTSTDGLAWYVAESDPGLFQFAVNATPVPEPGVLAFLLLGGLSLICCERHTAPRQGFNKKWIRV